MKYFLDTEFNEDGHTIDPHLDRRCGRGRARGSSAPTRTPSLHRVNPWVRQNVLPHLPQYGSKVWMPRYMIAEELIQWIGDEKPEFWGYYADYDWVVLCQMYGAMIALPKGWPRFCMDLKQLSVMKGNPNHPQKPVLEHDALADARWNRDLYKFLMELPNV